MSEQVTMRDKAVMLARQGFRVFPLPAGKKSPPLVPEGWDVPPRGAYHQHVPTSHADDVYHAWTKGNGEPHNYNIGSNTNDRLVVDVDNKDGKDGEAGLLSLGIEFPPTVEARTPTGGRHLYYRLPEGVSLQSTQGDRGGLAPGVDTRSWNGYVVAPGSRTAQGEYTWIHAPDTTPMAMAPEALIRLHRALSEQDKQPKVTAVADGVELDSDAAITRARQYCSDAAPEAVEGAGGREVTKHLLFRLGDFGLSAQGAVELLCEPDGWNDRCSPPWDYDVLLEFAEGLEGSRENALGCDNPLHQFDEVDVENEEGPKAAEATAPTPSLPPCLNVAAWASRQPAPRDWVVENRILNGNVALMTGDGGMGKTILTYELAMLVPAEIDRRFWLNSEVYARGPSLMLCCEDDEDEFQRRGMAIAAHHGIDLSAIASRLHLISMTGQMDTQLALPDARGVLRPTKLWREFEERACDIKPRIVVLDNVADLFGGEEIIRAQVRAFITMLRGLAAKARTAVILNAHPSLSGINSGRGTSGSTHWHNSVRHRFYMRKAAPEEAIRGIEDLRVVEVMKNQYGGGQGSTIPVRWQNGMFTTVTVAEQQQMASDSLDAARTLFKELLPNHPDVTKKKGGTRYAPKVFSDTTAAGQRLVTYKALEDAMDLLEMLGEIEEKETGTVRHPKKVLRVVD